MKFLRILLLPFSYLYGGIMHLRNLLYDLGVFSTTSFDAQIIAIGNLSVGGTGKTPHIEYVAKLLKGKYKIAVLSRGYKRKTTGYVLANADSTPETIGDEPFQIDRKFSNISVAVDEKRVRGIEKLLDHSRPPEVILLDDAFQHRAVKPGLNILLTDYHRLYTEDYVVPSGGLREFRSGSQRADIIVVTKTPSLLSPLEKRRLRDAIQPQPYQKLYFSFVEYGPFVQLHDDGVAVKAKANYFADGVSVLLVTGIATSKNLSYYLKNKCSKVDHLEMPDHYEYSTEDYKQIKSRYHRLPGNNKLVLTTEKDAVKWKNIGLGAEQAEIPIAYMPIAIKFHKNDSDDFDADLLHFVATNTANQRIHDKHADQ